MIETNETELKPCPFCGGKAEIIEAAWCGKYECYVSCTVCRVTQTHYLRSKRVAISEWNRRTDDGT